MRLIRILKFIYKAEHPHFLSVDKSTYVRWKWIIRMVLNMNKNYRHCEILRKKYKMLENFVVIGLKRGENPIKRRTCGYAKEFITIHSEAKCLYCDSKLTVSNATADHIIPISNGGNNAQINIIVCCKSCNSERGNLPFKEYLDMKNPKYKKVKYLFI